jgi:hypothetical protein
MRGYLGQCAQVAQRIPHLGDVHASRKLVQQLLTECGTEAFDASDRLDLLRARQAGRRHQIELSTGICRWLWLMMIS